MLLDRKLGFWRNRYEITADGLVLATWESSMWRTGGTFALDGRRYEILGNLTGRKYGMVTEDGTEVASTDRVGRRRWTVEVAGRVCEFQRASTWRREELLLSEGREVGFVERTSIWSSNAMADLPGLPVPVQIFVLAVVLTRWDAEAGAGAAGAAGAGS